MSAPLLESIEGREELRRSPIAEGLLGALKGAMIGMPSGYAIGKLSGGSGQSGAFIGGLLAAAAFGAGHAIGQDIQNKEQESGLRVHLENLKEREPFFYMPPKPLFNRLIRDVR